MPTHEYFELVAMIDQIKTRLDKLELKEPTTRAKATLAEVELFCVADGLTKEDAQWWWNKMESQGWRVDGKPVRRWNACITAWRLAKVFPSQKQANGHTITSLKAVLSCKEQVLQDLRNRHSTETAMGREWSDPKVRVRAKQLQSEIRELTNRIAQSA